MSCWLPLLNNNNAHCVSALLCQKKVVLSNCLTCINDFRLKWIVYDVASLTSISVNPNRFGPLHFNGLWQCSLSFDKPIPQIISTGLASTKILVFVPRRYFLSSKFCPNFARLPFLTISIRFCFQVSSSKPFTLFQIVLLVQVIWISIFYHSSIDH